MFNDLLIELKKKKFDAFAYADDLAVIGFNKCRLIEAIETIEEWAFKNDIIINKRKSGVMIHAKRGKTSNKDKGEIRGYPYKKSYTYLGIVVDKNLTFA